MLLKYNNIQLNIMLLFVRSLIPRPLKMDEGLSTSKRQAEGEKQLGKWRILPIQLLSNRQLQLSY